MAGSKINQQEKSKMQYIQYPLSNLLAKPTPHPEVPNPRSAFDLMCSQVHLKRENAVITHQGKPLAFLVSDLPPKMSSAIFEQRSLTRVPFNKACLNLSWFEVQAKPALCIRRSRPWFWLVPPSYQEYLDLPVFKVAGVLAEVDAGVIKPVPVKLGEVVD